MSQKTVFVTVGTTQFDELIKTITSAAMLDVLVERGFTRLLVQTGRGTYDVGEVAREDITVETYKYKPSIRSDIQQADLVISHAGAGSIQETLGMKKQLLVVVNETLMDCHQFELAQKMQDEGHLFYCTCKTLLQTLIQRDFNELTHMKPADGKLFGLYIDKLMGFEA